MSLHLLHVPVHQRGLVDFGRSTGLVKGSQAPDLGYLLHGLFSNLAERAPQPFAVQSPDPHTPFGMLPVLGYSDSDAVRFRAIAQSRGSTPALTAVHWDRVASKPMPALPASHNVGFRVSVCPVIRIGRGHPRLRPGAEVDPYVAQVQRDRALHGDAADAVQDPVRREAVYRDWLVARVGAAAQLRTIRMVAQRDAHLWRKGAPAPGAASIMYGQERPRQGPRTLIGRREAVFEGTLEVADEAAFSALLARGVGRHRAFGYGMILLRPC